LYHLIEKFRIAARLKQEVKDVHGNEVKASRDDAGLSQAQEETSSEESRVALHKTLSDGYAPENKHARRDWENNIQHPTWPKNIPTYARRGDGSA
jgi:hypothetical protein